MRESLESSTLTVDVPVMVAMLRKVETSRVVELTFPEGTTSWQPARSRAVKEGHVFMSCYNTIAWKSCHRS